MLSRNPVPRIGTDLFGNLTVDIVIRSNRTQDDVKNRILIEVRDLNYGLADSQVTRYLLHLLVTTVRDSDAMRRAVLLAAPRSWFEREAARGERSKWRYFLDHYTGLAQQFDVALGAIMIEQLPLLT